MAPWTKAVSKRYGVGKSLLADAMRTLVLGASFKSMAAQHVCCLAVFGCDSKVLHPSIHPFSIPVCKVFTL